MAAARGCSASKWQGQDLTAGHLSSRPKLFPRQHTRKVETKMQGDSSRFRTIFCQLKDTKLRREIACVPRIINISRGHVGMKLMAEEEDRLQITECLIKATDHKCKVEEHICTCTHTCIHIKYIK